ncbi:MAG: stage III sporulation protein AB [Defluviitaleaceae bacterium]|nr:stage III sporulation protein AB [Defluviitaleaceae bacterium]
MLFRFAGAAAVILGCTGLGFYYAMRDGLRVKELLEFKKALMILASEIEYMRQPLAPACGNIARRTEGTTANFFQNIAANIETAETAYQSWAAAIATAKPTSHLAPEDWEALDGFGKTLGYLDKNMQKSAIGLCIDYIDEKTNQLQTRSDKNKRMYHSLGAISGLIITVVLW